MTNKEEFIKILEENCKNRFYNLKEFVKYLEDKTDFFDAPASTKYHLSEKGGLVKHSLNVYHTLKNLCCLYAENISQDSIAIVGLLHDLCKTNFYALEQKNVKTNYGWTTQWGYTIDDQYPIGHGEKSVILLQPYIKLTKDEILAIRWHMGGFDNAFKGGEIAYSKAISVCKLLSLLEISDLLSTRILESDN